MRVKKTRTKKGKGDRLHVSPKLARSKSRESVEEVAAPDQDIGSPHETSEKGSIAGEGGEGDGGGENAEGQCDSENVKFLKSFLDDLNEQIVNLEKVISCCTLRPLILRTGKELMRA